MWQNSSITLRYLMIGGWNKGQEGGWEKTLKIKRGDWNKQGVWKILVRFNIWIRIIYSTRNLVSIRKNELTQLIDLGEKLGCFKSKARKINKRVSG